MWPVIGAVVVVVLLIVAVIIYARKQGSSDAKIKVLQDGARAEEREAAMVNAWTGRNLLRALRRVAGRVQELVGRDASSLHHDE